MLNMDLMLRDLATRNGHR